MEALQALLERRAFIISIEWDPNDLMKQSVRTALLIAAAMLMIFGASGYALIVVPDLHGDLVEIGVRPSVLGGTVLHLYFAAIAMFGFALMVSAAAMQAIRGVMPARIPLAIITVISVGIQLVLGMLLALAMHRAIFARGAVRAITLVPYGIVAVIAAYSWQYAWSLNSGWAPVPSFSMWPFRQVPFWPLC